jgi:LPXTG-motif cell wall-anchored protein
MAVAAMAAALAITPIFADPVWDKTTIFTIDKPVELPTTTLAPGSYMFRLTDDNANRHIVEVLNKDMTALITRFIAVPNERLRPTGNTVISFWEVPQGHTAAMRAWFYPGDNMGQEFLYPKNAADRLGQEAKTNVPSTDYANFNTTESQAQSAANTSPRSPGEKSDAAKDGQVLNNSSTTVPNTAANSATTNPYSQNNTNAAQNSGANNNNASNTGNARANDTAAAGGAVASGTETAAKDVGHGAEDVGKGAADVGKDVGKGAVDVGKDVGRGTVDVAKDIGKGAVDVGKDVGKGVEHAGKDVAGFFDRDHKSSETAANNNANVTPSNDQSNVGAGSTTSSSGASAQNSNNSQAPIVAQNYASQNNGQPTNSTAAANQARNQNGTTNSTNSGASQNNNGSAANQTGTPAELPKTASDTPWIAAIALMAIVGGLGMSQMRRRRANRRHNIDQ